MLLVRDSPEALGGWMGARWQSAWPLVSAPLPPEAWCCFVVFAYDVLIAAYVLYALFVTPKRRAPDRGEAPYRSSSETNQQEPRKGRGPGTE